MSTKELAAAIANNIRHYRASIGHSYATVAKATGVSVSSVVQWEQGKALPNIPRLILMARLFGVTVSDLLGEGGRTQVCQCCKGTGVVKVKPITEHAVWCGYEAQPGPPCEHDGSQVPERTCGAEQSITTRYKCLVCDAEDVAVKVEDTASDNTPAEVSYKCSSCGETAYFAYGHYENDKFNFCPILPKSTPTGAEEEHSHGK